MERPKVTLKSAISLDGFLDDNSEERLVLSSKEDLQAVDLLRSQHDAILVGAGTIRRDDPKLLVKSNHGKQPIKVTLTKSLELDPKSKFFVEGECQKIIYGTASGVKVLSKNFEGQATCVAAGETEVDLGWMLSHLYSKGIGSLLVEAGPTIGCEFISKGLVDTLRLAIAPVILGARGAGRFCSEVTASHTHFKVVSTELLGDTQVITMESLKSE